VMAVAVDGHDGAFFVAKMFGDFAEKLWSAVKI